MVYLSEDWFAACSLALESTVVESSAGAEEPVTFEYRITDIPEGHSHGSDEVSYSITIDPLRRNARIGTGNTDAGDVRFSMPYRVAHDIAQGSGSGPRAFLDGEIRVGGDVGLLLERAHELAQLNGLLVHHAASD